MKKIAVTFVTINQLAYTKAALASLKSSHELHVCLIDNGSTDETVAWAKENVEHVIENGGNVGLSIAWNQGARWAKEIGADYWMLPNNDVIFAPDCVDKMVDEFEKHPDWGLVSAVDDRDWYEKNGGIIAIGRKPMPEVYECAPHPNFACFMLTPRTFEIVGEFDEEFSRIGKAYFEDNDYHYRMHRINLPAMASPAASFYHYGSMTQNQGGGPLVPGEKFVQNRAYFVRKWGGTPEQVFNK